MLAVVEVQVCVDCKGDGSKGGAGLQWDALLGYVKVVGCEVEEWFWQAPSSKSDEEEVGFALLDALCNFSGGDFPVLCRVGCGDDGYSELWLESPFGEVEDEEFSLFL